MKDEDKDKPIKVVCIPGAGKIGAAILKAMMNPEPNSDTHLAISKKDKDKVVGDAHLLGTVKVGTKPMKILLKSLEDKDHDLDFCHKK